MISWACRPCGAGDWGPHLPKGCRFCGGPVVVTGRVHVVELEES